MKTNIENKVAVVFAASKGLGRACAMALAREGCRVAICSSNTKRIETARDEIIRETGAQVMAWTADVEKPEEITGFLNKVIRQWGGVDILVNNAGGPPVKSFEETTDEEWNKYFQITFMSVVRAIRAVIPFMKSNRWGRIINITSISVKEPIMNLIYSNSLRLAVVGLAKTLSRELGPYGITVHNVAPGYHRTDGLTRIVKKRVEDGEDEAAVYAGWENSVPLKKIGAPEDLAGLVVFLASEAANYMTGTTIQVDGGRYGGVI